MMEKEPIIETPDQYMCVYVCVPCIPLSTVFDNQAKVCSLGATTLLPSTPLGSNEDSFMNQFSNNQPVIK